MSGKKNPEVNPAPHTVGLRSWQALDGGWWGFQYRSDHSWPEPATWEG